MGPIGSAVLTFSGYKQTNTQTDTQTSKVYIEIKKKTLGCDRDLAKERINTSISLEGRVFFFALVYLQRFNACLISETQAPNLLTLKRLQEQNTCQ